MHVERAREVVVVGAADRVERDAVAERRASCSCRTAPCRGRRRASARGSRSRARTSSRRARVSEPNVCDAPSRDLVARVVDRRRRRLRDDVDRRRGHDVGEVAERDAGVGRDVGRAPARAARSRSCDRCRRRPGPSTTKPVSRARRALRSRATTSASFSCIRSRRPTSRSRPTSPRATPACGDRARPRRDRARTSCCAARASRAGAGARARSRASAAIASSATSSLRRRASSERSRARATTPRPPRRPPRCSRRVCGVRSPRRLRRSAPRRPRRRRRSCRSGTSTVPSPPLPSTAATYAVIVPAPAAGAVQHRSHDVSAMCAPLCVTAVPSVEHARVDVGRDRRRCSRTPLRDDRHERAGRRAAGVVHLEREAVLVARRVRRRRVEAAVVAGRLVLQPPRARSVSTTRRWYCWSGVQPVVNSSG